VPIYRYVIKRPASRECQVDGTQPPAECRASVAPTPGGRGCAAGTARGLPTTGSGPTRCRTSREMAGSAS